MAWENRGKSNQQSHTHNNKSTLDKLGDNGTSLTLNGVVVGGSGGSTTTITDSQTNGNVKVNGVDLQVYDDTDIRLSVGNTLNGVPLDKLENSVSGSWNLIDNDNFTDMNKVLWTDGKINTLANQAVTQFIKVIPGETYSRNHQSPVCFYDKDKNLISCMAQIRKFTVPNNPNIVYCRTSVPTTEVYSGIMYKSTSEHSGAHVEYNDRKVLLTNKDVIIESFTPNSEIPLFIETTVGGMNQPIHPKVLFFDTAWNGYKYWMAYTPFPNGASPAQENPSIAVSNDGIKWITPSGLTNPIVPAPANAGYTNYNSDTHLVYRSDTGLLECWYREVLGATVSDTENIKRVTSSNGITWSAPEILITTSEIGEVSGKIERLISPAVLYENSTYKMWVYDMGYIRRYDSPDALTWTDKGFITKQNGKQITSWHLDVIKNTDGKYELLNNDGAKNPANGILTHFVSNDGLNWTQTDWHMLPTYDTNRWDNKGFYRSTLFQANGKYYLIYTGINLQTGQWKLGLAISKYATINTLQGIDVSYKKDMAQPTRKNLSGNIGDIIYDTTLNKMIYCVEKSGVKTWIDANGTVI